MSLFGVCLEQLETRPSAHGLPFVYKTLRSHGSEWRFSRHAANKTPPTPPSAIQPIREPYAPNQDWVAAEASVDKCVSESVERERSVDRWAEC